MVRIFGNTKAVRDITFPSAVDGKAKSVEIIFDKKRQEKENSYVVLVNGEYQAESYNGEVQSLGKLVQPTNILKVISGKYR
ncbi:hypothetical protein COK29_27120 [Bacillus cereus]|uniref:hypothetical protein n=1 Tax=Bacillus cereus TaxID=1396 RepID=UPI000BF2655D|nr:hypothetical protein [Bacillus cereus]PFR62772.1 hypothetical protein COK29_27120 [Bacillus cereus]